MNNYCKHRRSRVAKNFYNFSLSESGQAEDVNFLAVEWDKIMQELRVCGI